MSNRTRVLLAILAICCVVAFSLFLIFNNSMREFILSPIITGINAVRSILTYMAQDVQWVATLLIVFVIVVFYLANRLPESSRRQRVPFVPPFPNQGPAMRLAHILEKSGHNKFRRERMILELRDLTARVLAYRQGVSIDDARDFLDTTDWTNNVAVSSFLSLDEHRAGKQKHKDFHNQLDQALAHIERTYQEV